MPEGPECLLTAEYLNELLQGQLVTALIIKEGDKLGRAPEIALLNEFLPATVESVECRGKLIYFTLLNEAKENFYVTNSLRMSGRWQTEEDKYCRAHWICDNAPTVYFRNPRKFGTLVAHPTHESFDRALQKIGPSILTDDFTRELFAAACHKKRRQNITAFLMNQQLFSGCGNYVKAEALYRAKISPHRKVGQLELEELDLLYQELKRVCQESYEARGLSIRDYAGRDGNKGEAERGLLIYNQPHATKEKTPDGRVTHWDPQVQV